MRRRAPQEKILRQKTARAGAASVNCPQPRTPSNTFPQRPKLRSHRSAAPLERLLKRCPRSFRTHGRSIGEPLNKSEVTTKDSMERIALATQTRSGRRLKTAASRTPRPKDSHALFVFPASRAKGPESNGEIFMRTRRVTILNRRNRHDETGNRNYESSKRNYHSTKHNHESGKRNHEPVKLNYETGSHNYEPAKRNYESTKHDYEPAKRNHESAEHNYKSTKHDYDSSKHNNESAKHNHETPRHNHKSGNLS